MTEHPREIKKQAESMRSAGMKLKEIAEALELPIPTVAHWVRDPNKPKQQPAMLKPSGFTASPLDPDDYTHRNEYGFFKLTQRGVFRHNANEWVRSTMTPRDLRVISARKSNRMNTGSVGA